MNNWNYLLYQSEILYSTPLADVTEFLTVVNAELIYVMVHRVRLFIVLTIT